MERCTNVGSTDSLAEDLSNMLLAVLSKPFMLIDLPDVGVAHSRLSSTSDANLTRVAKRSGTAEAVGSLSSKMGAALDFTEEMGRPYSLVQNAKRVGALSEYRLPAVEGRGTLK
jgi:hypothetical protein